MFFRDIIGLGGFGADVAKLCSRQGGTGVVADSVSVQRLASRVAAWLARV
jgi:hypothetical protein